MEAIAIADTGSTDILVKASQKQVLDNIKPCTELQVLLPNGSTIRSSEKGFLKTSIKGESIPAYIFSDSALKQTLLSIASFCNRGCTAIFTGTDLSIEYEGDTILHGTKQPSAKLWTIDLCPSQLKPARSARRLRTERKQDVGEASNAIRMETDAEFVNFISATFGNPAASTLMKASTKGYLDNVPRLTPAMISANLPNSVPSALGHLDQTRQGQQSTKSSKSKVKTPASGDIPDSNDAAAIADDCIHVRVVDLNDRDPDIMHTDATGRFPHTSRKGNNYVLISTLNGYIHYEAMRDRTAEQYTLAYERTIKFFRGKGNTFAHIRMDNEISATLRQLFDSLEPPIKVQLVPPGIHRANKSERSIRTGKNHLIAILCGVPADFPMNLWDETLIQAEITLNHLIPYTVNPAVSAYEGIYKSPYDFTHPMAPVGVKVIIHDKPAQRGTWAAHGVPGYYMGLALDNYRCWRTYSIPTKSMRTTDTVAWFPEPLRMPGSSPTEMMTAAITDLTSVLRTLSLPLDAQQRPIADNLATSVTAALIQLAQMYLPSTEPATVTAPPALPPHNAPAIVPHADPRVPDAAPPAPLLLPTPEHEPRNVRMTRNQQIIQDQLDVARIDEATRQRTSLAMHARSTPSQNSFGQQRVFAPQNRRYHQQRQQRKPHTAHVTSAAEASEDFDSVHRINALMKSVDPELAPNAQANAALNLTEDGQPLKYKSAKAGPDAEHWTHAECEEWVRLLTSRPGKTNGTGTCIPRHPHDQPSDRKGDTAYYNPQIKEKMGADGVKTYRIRGTFGGDRLRGKYPFEVTARTAELEVVRLLLNSTISTEQARFMTIDIKDYYLGTPMDRSEWMWVDCKFIPESIMIEYELHKYIVNGRILFEVVKGMYGLPQAGILAQKQLVKRLAIDGYIQHDIVPCLFTHISNGITFTLVVDDFGIKYTNIVGAEHLISTLQKHYEIKVNMAGDKYLGMSLDFDYSLGKVAISIPGYIEKVILQFRAALNESLIQYKLKPTTQAASPSIYVPPKYGKQGPQFTVEDNSIIIDDKAIKVIQGIVGSMLYYSRVTDPTFVTSVNDMASEQATPTTKVLLKADRILAYAASYPNNQLVFKRSDMKFQQTSDCFYLSRRGSLSTGGGEGFMGMNDPNSDFVNGSIYEMSKIIDVVVASVAEGEYASVFMNAKKGAWIRVVCEALGHPQSTTRIRCDNECAVGIANDTVKIKRSKSFDMRWHWIRDRIRQGQFSVEWEAGVKNRADFYTKALPVHEHQECMKQIVHVPIASATHFQSRRAREGNAWRIKQSLQAQ